MTKEYKHKTVSGFFTAHSDRWIKGAYSKGEKINGKLVTCFCLAGKVNNIHKDVEDQKSAMRKLADAIEELHPKIYKKILDNYPANHAILNLKKSIKDLHPTVYKQIIKNNTMPSTIVVDFNDHPSRTIREIIEVAQYAAV
jgi:uncharacterized coiled-coil DUF342 family protein